MWPRGELNREQKCHKPRLFYLLFIYFPSPGNQLNEWLCWRNWSSALPGGKSLEWPSTSAPATAAPEVTVWMWDSWSLCWAGCCATCHLCWGSPSSSAAASSKAWDAAESGQSWAPAALPTRLWPLDLLKVLPSFRCGDKVLGCQQSKNTCDSVPHLLWTWGKHPGSCKSQGMGCLRVQLNGCALRGPQML